MRKTTNLDAGRSELVSARRLYAALPLAAAAEPIACCGHTRGVTVVHSRERQCKSPGPGEVVKPHCDTERHGHQTNGGAGEEPGRIVAGQKREPRQEKCDEQSGQGDEEEQEGIVELS